MRKLLLLLIPASVLAGWVLSLPPRTTPAPTVSASVPTPRLLPPVTVPATPTTATPATSPSGASSGSSASTSPTPRVGESGHGSSSPSAADPGPQSGTAEQAAIAWLRASRQVDTSRPYPGLDLSSAADMAVGPAAADLARQRTEWASPRESDTVAWKQLLEQRYRSQLVVVSSTTAGGSVTVTFRVDETRNGHTSRGVADAVTVQLEPGPDGSWRVTRELSNPQAP